MKNEFTEDGMPRIAINMDAPDFSLADYNGKTVRLSGLRGRTVLLVFNRGFI
jgi:peroxiredoxin